MTTIIVLRKKAPGKEHAPQHCWEMLINEAQELAIKDQQLGSCV